MYDYRIDKTIDQLDPVPSGSWEPEQVDAFFDSALVPIAGITPQGSYRTFRNSFKSIIERYTKLPVFIGNSGSSPTSPTNNTATFEITQVSNAGDAISIQSDVLKVDPGWYHVDAVTTVNFSGTASNTIVPVTFSLELDGTEVCSDTIQFDYSYPSNSATLHLHGITVNSGTDAASLVFKVTGLLDGSTATLNHAALFQIRPIDTSASQ